MGNHIIFNFCLYHFHMIFTFWSPEYGPRLQSGGRESDLAPARRCSIKKVAASAVDLQLRIILCFYKLFIKF